MSTAPTSSRAAARSGRLRYTSDDLPGIRRERRGRGFAYRHADGRAVRAARTLARIRSLVLPPAWRAVWICCDARGHLQATGVDARGRKQYHYHPDWVAVRDSNKFGGLLAFARALPRIRRAVRRDLALRALCKRRVLAAVVQLMDRAHVRVGNERYRRANGSFGLTTLRERHVQAAGANVILEFRGKAGKAHHIKVQDPQLARAVRECLDLPGQVLFRYYEGEQLRSITAQDVNHYLKQISRRDITSKDFRTWGGTVQAAAHLRECGPAPDRHSAQRNLRAAICAAAELLHNTPAVCRRSYIHPLVFARQGGAPETAPRIAGLRRAEHAVVALLRSAVHTRRQRRVLQQRPRRTRTGPPLPITLPARRAAVSVAAYA
ncbi:MAG: DNA topoisomerase IB [Gammaproteobacteria bacterium]|nr:DNA topoisomerase IB [Gammaproteobacteria bacterium]